MSRPWNTVLEEHLTAAAELADAGPTLDRIADALIACFGSRGRVYVFGNGGSAADAQHIAGELLGRYKLDRPAQPAIALTTDSSTMSAIANDLGYEQVFARQLEAVLQPGDVAWALSTSGNSPNILNALDVAKSAGARVIGFAGRDGGKMAPHCDLLFKAPHDASDRIQEMHELAYHYVCERVEAAVA